MNAVLISTYDLGRQPFGLASPAAWLRRRGVNVRMLDLSQEALAKHESEIREADLIAFYLPMHTATRIGIRAIRRVKELNPSAHLSAYGLYAPIAREQLREAGVRTILGGEFEQHLAELAERIATTGPEVDGECISHERLAFEVPDRSGLPVLDNYSQLVVSEDEQRVAGYTEASRGCKHLCRHCPVVPVYKGKFRVIQREVVLADIRRQVEAGAQHITFGDPDFFNGPTHAIAIVEQLHHEFPELSYDATIKVEHLLKHSDLLPTLRDTGCAFVITAVESFDDRVLEILDKGHTRADFISVVRRFREVGLALSPTFVAFHPWTTLESYEDFLLTIAEQELVENVQPIQLAIRLLIPPQSLLLKVPEVQDFVREFDAETLSHRWSNPDPRVDELQRELEKMVQFTTKLDMDRQSIFETAWHLLQQAKDTESVHRELPPLTARAAIPHLTEPWYC